MEKDVLKEGATITVVTVWDRKDESNFHRIGAFTTPELADEAIERLKKSNGPSYITKGVFSKDEMFINDFQAVKYWEDIGKERKK